MNSSNLLNTFEDVEMLLNKVHFQGVQNNILAKPLKFINLHVTNKDIALFLFDSYQISESFSTISPEFSFSGKILMYREIKKSLFLELLYFFIECGKKYGCKEQMNIIIENFRKNAEIQDFLESI